MDCLKCGRKCIKGIVKSEDTGHLINVGAGLSWTPEYEKEKIMKKDTLFLKSSGVGYYCQFCETVYASFELSDIKKLF